jgi:hypothetical protein
MLHSLAIAYNRAKTDYSRAGSPVKKERFDV